MKFDLSKFPVAEDDTQLKDEKGKLANYRDLFIKALTSDIQSNGQPILGEDKFKRYDMYTKIKKAIAIIDFSAADVVMLTDAALVFPSIVAGQARDFLAKPEADSPSE